MTEEEKFLASAAPASSVPLQEEFKVLANLVDESCFEGPLKFCTVSEKALPVLSAVARRVLAIPATVGGSCSRDRT